MARKSVLPVGATRRGAHPFGAEFPPGSDMLTYHNCAGGHEHRENHHSAAKLKQHEPPNRIVAVTFDSADCGIARKILDFNRAWLTQAAKVVAQAPALLTRSTSKFAPIW